MVELAEKVIKSLKTVIIIMFKCLKENIDLVRKEVENMYKRTKWNL